ncbi:DUF1490 family protein [Mycobacterium sp. SM1]|uniref:DUF1490 family protein n=1 Tax=Mycobacterium sp. SM1 TaxID=2816243 RepID=UPI001BCCE707|nr:DUF1490 family protein [Mycobacterium sp. SM1]MBS4728658.1 DUF1490 family protein [Mycobacterium sp. SM1]
MTARHGWLAKAAPMVGTHVLVFAGYEALHRALAKVPWRKATVSTTAWGLRAARKVESTAKGSAEKARLMLADMLAEAVERIGEEVPPPAAESSAAQDR